MLSGNRRKELKRLLMKKLFLVGVLILVGCGRGVLASVPQAAAGSIPINAIPGKAELAESVSDVSPLLLIQSSQSPTPTLKITPNSSFETTPTSGRTSRASNLVAVATASPPPTFRICSPLEGYPLDKIALIVSAPYTAPPQKSDARHAGVDLVFNRLATDTAVTEGVGIQSVLPGRVAASIPDSFPYGNFAIIETPYELLPAELVDKLGIPPGQSLYLLYAHMQAVPLVALRDQVAACQLIGRVGHSGNTIASHLHLETRIGIPGAVFKVMAGLLRDVTPEERANYKYWRISGTFRHFDPLLLLTFQW
jgi:murein DD-endopeptidase MepM/ murein hydrolase activator NlpD